MIVYNITMKVKREIEKDWIKWQQEEHIPEIIETGLFSEYKFFRLLDHEDEEGITYVIQYFAPSRENYNEYISKFAPAFRQKAFDKWENQFIAFRTTMESVQ